MNNVTVPQEWSKTKKVRSISILLFFIAVIIIAFI